MRKQVINLLGATVFVVGGTALWRANTNSAAANARTDGAFDPSQTDVFSYTGFRFAEDKALSLNIGWGSMIRLFLFPNAIKTLNKGDSVQSSVTPVNIFDARKASPSPTLSENGFTLMKLIGSSEDNNVCNSSYYEPENWNNHDQVARFHSMVVVPMFQKLFPNATRFEITKETVRGKRTAAPATVGAVHTDVLYDLDAADKYYSEFGHSDRNKPMYDAIKKREDEVLDAIVVLWKPIEMKGPVCDRPLALMDASTYLPRDEHEYRLHLNFWPFFKRDGLGGVPAHRADQKWYYYPFMTTKEALLFVQYDRKKGFFKVPHGAFANPNCPPETEPRISHDYRIMVFSSSTEEEGGEKKE